MKNPHKLMALAVLLAGCAVSCSKEGGTAAKPEADAVGTVSFGILTDNQIETENKSSVSEFTTLPPKSEFILRISDAAGQAIWEGKLSQWNPATPLKVGKYSVVANYGNVEEEGFDKPCFGGSRQFEIVADQSVEAPVTVTLANAIIKPALSVNFLNYIKDDYVITVKTGAGTSILFTKGENRAAFVDADKITVSANLKNQAGQPVPFTQKEISDMNVKTCYRLSFDTKTGGAAVQINFDYTTTEVKIGDIELND